MTRYHIFMAHAPFLALAPVACVGQISGTELEASVSSIAVEPAGVALSQFTSQETCNGCHPRQVEEWKQSAHSHAMADSVFQALVARVGNEKPESRSFCLSCHTNVGTAAGGFDAGFDFAKLQPVVMEGVTCESCHRVTDVFRVSNAGHDLDPDAPMQGTVRAGDTSPYHETEKSPVLASAELCGSCHDVQNGQVPLEQPYVEWSEAPARNNGQVCMDCHMPQSYGEAAEGFGLPPRPVRSHAFAGSGSLMARAELSEAGARSLTRDVKEHLSRSVSVEFVAPAAVAQSAPGNLRVVLENHVAGHRFPTGSAFFRELWVHVTVSDARGLVIFDSADPEARNAPELSPLWLSARLLDAEGKPTLFPWRAEDIQSHSLAPLERRAIDLSVPIPLGVEGPLRAQASLEFRAFPAALLEELGLPPDLASPTSIGQTSASIAVLAEP